MLNWKKVGYTTAEDGRIIRYAAEGCRFYIDSVRRAIPHASGSGSWLYTSYFLVDPDTGTEREYHTLTRAKKAAEDRT